MNMCNRLGGRWTSTWADERSTVEGSLHAKRVDSTVPATACNNSVREEEDVARRAGVVHLGHNTQREGSTNQKQKEYSVGIASSNLNSKFNLNQNSVASPLLRNYDVPVATGEVDHVSNSEGAGSSRNQSPTPEGPKPTTLRSL